jgi:hypothetical protein
LCLSESRDFEEMNVKTHESLSDKLEFYFFSILAIGVPVSMVAFIVWSLFSFIQEAQTIDKAPVSKATALITSKDPDQKLSVKSTDLPKKGDVVDVDQYAYGAVSVGDSVCVQFKRLPDDPQYGIEFVSQGSCQK